MSEEIVVKKLFNIKDKDGKVGNCVILLLLVSILLLANIL